MIIFSYDTKSNNFHYHCGILYSYAYDHPGISLLLALTLIVSTPQYIELINQIDETHENDILLITSWEIQIEESQKVDTLVFLFLSSLVNI